MSGVKKVVVTKETKGASKFAENIFLKFVKLCFLCKASYDWVQLELFETIRVKPTFI